jgi:hypothetical protein
MQRAPGNGSFEDLHAGPRPVSAPVRAALCRGIVDRLRARYGARIRAILVTGSVARGLDHGFSDLDLTCVLRAPDDVDHYHEWVHGDNKIEIAILGEQRLLVHGSTVTAKWPFSPGAYLSARLLHGDEAFLDRLQGAIRAAPKEDFDRAIRELLIDGLYGVLSKLRGVAESGNLPALPQLAVEFAEDGASLIALLRRYPLNARITMLQETSLFPHGPAGFSALCALVLSGSLADPAEIQAACEGFWQGVVPWVQAEGVDLSPLWESPFP